MRLVMRLNDLIDIVQYRWLNPSHWKRVWNEKVTVQLFPKNKWARKDIPKTFSDVDYIYEKVLFNGLIFWWEDDGGESEIRHQFEYDYSDDGFISPEAIENRKQYYKTMYNELHEAYIWAILRDWAYEEANFDYKLTERYNEVDTTHLIAIIKYRPAMWT